MQTFAHTTVLLHETVNAILPNSNGRYVDCTLGGAGHSRLILESSQPNGQLLAFDQDESAIRNAAEVLRDYGVRIRFVHANFRRVGELAPVHGFDGVDGVVFDLGVSSPQFDQAERGFSYRQDAPLDMRMDPTSPVRTARDFVNDADEQELVNVFFSYGEEKFSRRIAKAIIQARQLAPIETTVQLADLIKEAIPAAARRSGPHPARRVFQALRIAVNDELGSLKEALQGAFKILKPGGRLAVITFHSLEDRIAKQTFADFARGCICPPELPICQCGRTPEGKLITRKPILPSEAEIEQNPRARSAKLRVVEKV